MTDNHTLIKPIIIVGAGAAGIGIGITLKQLKLPFIIIDKAEVGDSFKKWNTKTRFISPSFSSNAFGQVDLNALTPDTSPAFSIKSEHPTGKEYAKYLEGLVKHFDLPVKTGITVDSIEHDPDYEEPFTIHTSQGDIFSQYVIWAGGEYQYPKTKGFVGAKLCTHYADIRTWESITETHDTDDIIYVFGGYESGIDAVYQLVKLGKKVVLFDGDNQIDKHGSDSSYTLSPFTRDRLREVSDDFTVITANIQSVRKVDAGYAIKDQHGKFYTSTTAPINCTGFASSLTVVNKLFAFEKNQVVLSKYDESTICPNLFLAGPQVRHGAAIFCFIYKYRQRFGIVGECISNRVGGDVYACELLLEYYRKTNFLLDDLSCCEDECVC